MIQHSHKAENAERIPPCQPKTFRMHSAIDADNIPHMVETIQDRIRSKMEEHALNPSQLSIRAGVHKDTVRKLLASDQQQPHGKTLRGLASALGVSEQWLLTGIEALEHNPATPPPLTGDARVADVPPPQMVQLPTDVPVFGTAAGSHGAGAFYMEGVIDYVRRPPALVGAKNVYALFIEGSSMEPEHNPGDLRFVHPDRPPRIGDSVIVQTRNGSEDSIEATIGRLARRSSTTLTIGKLNPPADLEIETSRILAVHKVLTLNELFGM